MHSIVIAFCVVSTASFTSAVVLATAPKAVASKATAPTADWPTFRGSDRMAVSKDTGLLQEWPEDGPPLLWETKGAGRGYASLAIAGNRIYTLGDAPSTADDEDEYLLCFRSRVGKPLLEAQDRPRLERRQARLAKLSFDADGRRRVWSTC